MLTFARAVSKPAGPNHAATSSGSVQARNTWARGASKMRVRRISWSSIAGSFPAQVRVQPVHPRLPRPLACLHPVDRVVERVRLHPAGPPLGVAAADDQARLLEHLQVARD